MDWIITLRQPSKKQKKATVERSSFFLFLSYMCDTSLNNIKQLIGTYYYQTKKVISILK
jgi:hypothetical protein